MLILFLGFPAFAQLIDDFSDGDLDNNPAWMGNTDLFQVNVANTLQLMDPDPESSNESILYLPAPVSTNDATTWEIYFSMDFSPSASNFGQIYLQADSEDLLASPNGYFLKLGGISGSDDALELYLQDGDDSVLLIAGTSGALGSDPAEARVRITRSTSGEWELFADYTGGTDFQSEGTAVDNTFQSGNFFGLICNYTSTRNEDFYFDDLLIDPLYVDTDAPQLLSATAQNATQIEVVFNEALDPLSAETVSNYEVDQGIGQPLSAAFDPAEPNVVQLDLNNLLQDGQTYQLAVNGVADVSQNILNGAFAEFEFIEESLPLAFDVLIHEIMADPAPSVGLPNAEFLELYNASDKNFELEGWSITSGSSPEPLPAFLLESGGYVIICDEEDAFAFEAYGPVLGLSSMPSLSNSGDELALLAPDQSVIHLVTYTDEWYGSSAKDDGGWTLEMINPEAPCLGGENWVASEDLNGGTPAAANSVYAPEADETGVALSRVYPEDESTLVIQFSELPDSAKAANPAFYLIEPNVMVEMVILNEVYRDRAFLFLEDPLDSNTIYEISLAKDLSDCIGNPGQGNALKFGLPATPKPGELIINEVLYHPEVGGSDFVEIFHAGQRPFDLANLVVGNIQGSSDSLSGLEVSRLLFPGDYLVLTESPADLLEQYTVPQPENLVKADLPVFSAPSGNVSLVSITPGMEALVLESFDYSDDLHHPLLDDTRGVSLERIRISDPVNSGANWHSAAATAGYATPTGPNSQAYAPANNNEKAFSLVHPSFSPDGDGYQDLLLLDYKLEETGFTANIRVFNASGNQVNVLAANAILGASGSFQWEGNTSNNDLAPMGIYVLWIEYFHPDGRRLEEKISFVLAKDLN
ncbi:MAG: hypothetical protein GYB31_13450 [Bacteroidetes bacterium]|nr:hypothetical protein [Bacteroidota bacterium]